MGIAMQPEEIDPHPERITIRQPLPSGETVCLRPLTTRDGFILGEYFLGLSETTRALYAPHAFDQATADQICAAINSAEILRMLVTSEREGQERVIAYFILLFGVRDAERQRYQKLGITLDPSTDCLLAPSVADDYQNMGLGSVLMNHLQHVLRRCGRKRIVLWGGTLESNKRAIHFYRKSGFRKVGEFMTGVNNYDMIVDLSETDTSKP